MIWYSLLLIILCANIFSNMMHNEFEMTMIGELQYFLGLQIHPSKKGIFINQVKCCEDLTKIFGMEKAKQNSTQ